MNTPQETTPSAAGSLREDSKRDRRLKYITAQHPERANLFRQVYLGGAGPRRCIKAFCLECNGWEEDAIRHCNITVCPLWRHRPFQDPKVGGTAVEPALESEGPVLNGLPPIQTMEEMEQQLEAMEERNEPAHFIPQRDGIY
jgi:hypothetical protein